MGNIKSVLINAGLTKEQATVFETLLRESPQTVLEVSRKTSIPRTTCYRVIEDLVNEGILEEIIEEHRKVYSIGDVSILDRQINARITELESVRNAIPLIDELVREGNSLEQPGTAVKFYRGKRGIQQMGWNTLKANNILRGYTYRKYAEIVGEKFDRDWAEEFQSRGLIFKELYSDAYLESVDGGNEGGGLPWVESKYLPSFKLDINHQVDIYTNVVAFYNWHEGEVFGVEIYDDKVATFQKQLFDLLWEIAG